MFRLVPTYIVRHFLNGTREVLTGKGTRIDQLAAMSCARVKCKENTSDQTKKQSSEMLGAKCPAPKVLGIREVKQSPTSPVDTAPLQSPSKPKTLYRRPLPESCIAFASEEGKTIFREALATGHMNCYFRLASQFRTQDEPAYCGLATMVMVLNALEIDPGRVWKGPWKWYHEDMLDCCVSTEIMLKEGITFDEFVCLADCNALDTEAVRVNKSSKEEDFRALVKEMTEKEDAFLVLSYSRALLNQTGDGHFAPVSGYHPVRDLVLILDTARFKYPPHWIPLPQLFESMKALDKSTGLPRGYIQVKAAQDTKTLLLFKISEQFSISASQETKEQYQAFLSAWAKVTTTPTSFPEDTDLLPAVVSSTLQGLVEVAGTLNKEVFVLTTQEHIRCTDGCRVQCVVQDLLSQLDSTALFQSVCKQVNGMSGKDVQQLQSLFGFWPKISEGDQKRTEGMTRDFESSEKLGCCDMNQMLCLCHFVSAFLLSWPYAAPVGSPTLGSALQTLVQDDLSRPHRELLKEETASFLRQLRRLTSFHSAQRKSPSMDKICCSDGSSSKPCHSLEKQ